MKKQHGVYISTSMPMALIQTPQTVWLLLISENETQLWHALAVVLLRLGLILLSSLRYHWCMKTATHREACSQLHPLYLFYFTV